MIVLILLFGRFMPQELSAQRQFKCSYDSLSQNLLIKDQVTQRIIFEQIPPFRLWLSDNKYTLGGESMHNTNIVPEIKVITQPDGFDIEYTYFNRTKDTSSMGEFFFGRMKLDSLIYFRNTNYTFQDDPVKAKKNIQYVSSARIYPFFTSYSPVTILHDNNYIFGISIVYPFQEYKHTINQLLVGSFFDHQTQGWDLVIQSNESKNGQTYINKGELSPGQTRVYKVY